MIMLAHKNQETGRIQLIGEHTENVASICKEYGSKIDISNTAELTGYYHDITPLHIAPHTGSVDKILNMMIMDIV